LHKMPRLITKISFIFYGLHDGPRWTIAWVPQTGVWSR
jgi:hypothetical protein